MVRLRLDELLEERGRTLYWLAKATGMNHTSLWRYRHEQTEGIKWAHLESICEALECEPGDLIEIVRESSPPKRKVKVKS